LKGLFGGAKPSASPVSSADDAGQFELRMQTFIETIADAAII
jgi:hypothetical protein